MAGTPMWRRYLRFFGSDVADDVASELRFHLEAKVDELIAQGWGAEAAKDKARQEFGDVAAIGAACRDLQRKREGRIRMTDYFTGWRQDFVYGLRQLLGRWPTTLLAVLTLGIGVGAVAAVFGIVHAVVLQPLPFPEPSQLVTVRSTREGREDFVTPRNFDSWRRDLRSFQQLAGLERTTFTLSEGGTVTQVAGGEVTANFFSVFGVSPELGRTFTSDEDITPRQHLVVLSDRLWRDRFNADPGVVGRQIHLDRESYTVLGVMPRRLDLRTDGEQFWTPLALSGQEMNWTGGVLHVYGRLKSGVSLKQAQAEMSTEARLLEARYPEMNRGREGRVREFAADLVGEYRQQLFILLAAVGSVFLIACANVANLLLARATGRTRELTIRRALGATQSRIIRQLLTESFLLGLAGAVLGLLVTVTAIHVVKVSGATIPRLDEASVDGRVLLVLLGLAVCCTLLSGTLPALRAAKLEAQGALVQGGRSVAGLGRDRARNVYIAFEAGLALVLLIAAGLLIRSAVAAQSIRPGFVAEHVIAGRTALPANVYKTADQIGGAYERIRETLAARPGVRSAALTSKVPLGLSNLGLILKPDAVSPNLKEELSTELQYISPDYFATMQIPLQRGRDFNERDSAGSATVVLVNETLARRLWADRDPVGQQLRLPDLDEASPMHEVVGVVSDVHDKGLMAPPPPVMYVPVAQVAANPWHWAEQSLYVVARARTESLASADTLRTALHMVDSELPLGDALTMEQRLTQSVAAARFYTLLLTILGLCGLILTAAGIYGVVAYFVSRQRAEIGIRIALGATRGNVLLLVVRQGMRPVLAGTALGVVVALIVSRALAAELHGIGSTDPLTFVAVTAVLLGTAALACYLPARQASLVDPVIALRSE